MSESFDQIFIHVKQLLLAPLAGAPDWMVQIASSLINIFAARCVSHTLRAHFRAGAENSRAHAKSLWTKSRRAVRTSSTGGRRHQDADQGRHRASACR